MSVISQQITSIDEFVLVIRNFPSNGIRGFSKSFDNLVEKVYLKQLSLFLMYFYYRININSLTDFDGTDRDRI